MTMLTALPFSAAAKGSLWAEPRIAVPPKPEPNSNPCGELGLGLGLAEPEP